MTQNNLNAPNVLKTLRCQFPADDKLFVALRDAQLHSVFHLTSNCVLRNVTAGQCQFSAVSVPEGTSLIIKRTVCSLLQFNTSGCLQIMFQEQQIYRPAKQAD